MLAEVDDLVSAELPGQRKPLVHAVDDDHAARPHLARHGARVDAEAARALDDDGLPGPEAGEVEAGVDLGESAVDAGRHLVGDLVCQLEDGVVRAQVEVLAEAALEVRPHLAGDKPVGLAHRARLGALLEARAAAPAREEIPVGDAVAHCEGPAGGVGRDPRPELRHPSHVLVARVERQRSAHLRVVQLTPPVVQVGATHVRERDLDERRPRLRIRHRVLADLERLSCPMEYRHPRRLRHSVLLR